MIIDAHQHVWDLDRAEYPWLGPDVPQWNRTFEFEDVRPHLRSAGVDGCVLVQAADNRDDTDHMLAVAAVFPEVVGVVVHVPLDRPQETADRLAELRVDRRVVGVRNLIHEQPDPDWILRPDVDESLGILEQLGIPFDYVAVLPRHLEHVPALLEMHPSLQVVIDHLAKPPVGLDDWEPWWTLIEAAAQHPLVHAKISGLYGARDMATWTPETIRPFVDRALELFGPERLMYGGDWPICVAAGGYDRIFAGIAEALSGLGDAEMDQIMGGTAVNFYSLDDDMLDRARRSTATSDTD